MTGETPSTGSGNVGQPRQSGKSGNAPLTQVTDSQVQPELLRTAAALTSSGLSALVSSAASQPVAAAVNSNGVQQPNLADPQQQQLIWQQAVQQLSAVGPLGVPPPLVQAPPPQTVVTTSSAAPSTAQHSYFAPAGVAPTPVAAMVANVPVQQFLQALNSAPAAAVPTMTGSTTLAPILPSTNSHKRKLKETVGGKGEKSRKVEPSVVSSYSNMSAGLSEESGGKDFPDASQLDLDKMSPAERRRYERNLREQQRSYRISQQIKRLRDVLTESKIPFKPNKFSILIAAADYIKQLQTRAIMLDSEHQKLLATIRETTDLVNSGQIPSSIGDAKANEVSSCSESDTNSDMLLVQGLDYECVFEQCPFAMGATALDGRLLGCNSAFEDVMGHARGEMVQQSLFMFIRNHQDVFEAMADLLTRSTSLNEESLREEPLYWCGKIESQRSHKLSFSITLTSTDDGNPKFFSISAAGLPD